MGRGAVNTHGIVLSLGEGAYAAYYAASLEYEHDGIIFDDWFLPSRHELEKLYESSVISTEGYRYLYYWSSTERHSATAWVIDLTTGDFIGGAKENSGVPIRARMMRSF